MRALAITAFLIAACATPAPPPAVAPARSLPRPLYAQNGGRTSLTRRLLDWTGLSENLPRDSNGRISVLRISGYDYEINPALDDPLTALAACADLITTCESPASPLDQCIASARVCQTPEPWHESSCCPAACRASYDAARRSGTNPNEAFQSVYFRQPDCFPGVRAMIGAEP